MEKQFCLRQWRVQVLWLNYMQQKLSSRFGHSELICQANRWFIDYDKV